MTADTIIARTATGALVASLMATAFTVSRLALSGYGWARTAEWGPDFIEGLFGRGVAFGDTLGLMAERVAIRLGVLDEVLDRMIDGR